MTAAFPQPRTTRYLAWVLVLGGAGCTRDAPTGSGGPAPPPDAAGPSAPERELLRVIARHPAGDPEGLKAKLQLGRHRLAAFAPGEARAAFRDVVELAPRQERSLVAAGLLGLARCAELLDEPLAGREAWQRLHREFRDLPPARLAAAALQRLASPPLRLGDPAPALKAPDLNGRVQDLASRRGRPVLLAFFASDDPRSADRTGELLRAWAAGGGAVDDALLADVAVAPGPLPELVGKRGWSSPVIPCSGPQLETVLARFRVQAVPAAMLIGPDGALLLRDPQPAELRRALRELR